MPIDFVKAKELFLAVLEMPAPQRASYLETACAGDTALRQRVEAMLHTHESSGELLPRSPAEMLADSGATEADATAAFDRSAHPSGTQVDHADGSPHDLSFLTPSANPSHLGRLGHYEIHGIVGKGGFGIVLKAFDERLHRVVAIKVLSPAYAAHGAARKRFIREAQTAAAIKNEHVVAIYDVEKDAQPPYLAMELIDGISLQDKLDKQGPLSVKEVLRIGLQMAEGLAAAHKQGLVHRDIKPANILLENGVERVKITDFGLARAVDDASVTQSGTVAGTPMYMSPEQAEGLQIDHRSDLFSLGTVLYAMCTGHPPFRASGTHAVLKRVIDASPRPIREINNEVPDWLCDIITKLHAKKPEDRFQTAKEVAELLGQRLADVQAGRAIERASRVSGESETQPPPAHAGGSQRWPRWSMVLLGLLALLCSLVLVAYFADRWFFGDRAFVEFDPGNAAVDGALMLDRNGSTRVYPLTPGIHVAVPVGTYRVEFVCRSNHKFDAIWLIEGDQQRPLARDEKGWRLELQKAQYIVIKVDTSPVEDRGPPAEPGWVQIFNGKDLKGWQANENWTVRDGALWSVPGEGARNLRTVREDFANFHLRVEAQINQGGNSGIFFRDPAGTSGPGYYEVQINADSDPIKTGSLWNLGLDKAVKENPINPDEWFTLEVIAIDNDITVKVNDKITTHWTDPDRKLMKGALVLQQYNLGTIVAFRKIEIKELPIEQPGWVQLFNGKDLTNWKSHPNWRVEKGILVASGPVNKGKNANLASVRKDFGDFHLRLEARVPNDKCDSGVLFRSKFGPAGHSFCEANIGFSSNTENIGSLAIYKVNNKEVQDPWIRAPLLSKPNEWFTLEIIARGQHIITKVNGTIAAETRNAGLHPHGQIHLQQYGETTVVEFKKIEIKELRSEPPPLAVAPFDAKKAKEHQDAWAKHLGVDVEIENSIGMKLRIIPAGEFLMGSSLEQLAKVKKQMKEAKADKAWVRLTDLEAPAHPVRLTKPYYMGVHEVTIGQFRRFVEAKQFQTEPERDGKGGRPWDPAKGDYYPDPKVSWKNPGRYVAKDNHPVTNITWNDADEFCRWLSKEEGRTYRLATEAEWEFACRAGSNCVYSFGEDPFDLAKHVVFNQDGPNEVGSRKANAFGLFDMEGNVWEWCADWLLNYSGSAETDPVGARETTQRVYRGAGFSNMNWACRNALRSGDVPTDRSGDTGFRVVLVGDLTSKAPTEPGWVQLFNGKDLQGWTPRPADQWKVVNNVIVGDGLSELQTNQEYQNFHCRMEVKMNLGGEGEFGFRATRQNYMGVTIFGRSDVDEIGSLSHITLSKDDRQIEPLVYSTEKLTTDDWVTLEVIAQGTKTTVKVNGTTTAEKTFAGMLGRGFIQFAVGKPGSVMQIRKIEIKELPPGEPGWVQLFNGKDLTAWVPPADNAWKVESELLVGRGPVEPSAFVSKRTDYRDFHLRADIEIDASAAVDSRPGFMLYPRWQNGVGYGFAFHPKPQKFGHFAFGKQAPQSDIFVGLQRPLSQRVWHQFEMTAKGPDVSLTVDGQLLGRAKGEWTQGAIAFHAANQVVTRVRNIEIKELPSASEEADRRAAEYVLSLNDHVHIFLNGEDRRIEPGMALPAERFELRYVHLWNNPKVTDTGLSVFQHCKNITELHLGETGVTDVGLANFKNCTNLTVLSLNQARKIADDGLAAFKDCTSLTHVYLGTTNVTSTGIRHLKGNKNLAVLNLGVTGVDDSCAEVLKEFNNLTSLHIERTKITPATIETLKKALPACRIQWDGGFVEPSVRKTTDNLGWVPLFNGKDLTGWKKPAKGVFEVKNGLLVATGVTAPPGGDLLVSEIGHFQNLHLRYEAMVSDKAANLMFRLSEDGNGYGASVGTVVGVAAFGLKYDGVQYVSPRPSVPANQWFVCEVRVEGTTATVWLDGKHYADAKGLLVRRGPIGIRTTLGNVVQFRRIEIKELPPEAPGRPVAPGTFAPLPNFGNEKPTVRKAFQIQFQPNSNDLFAKIGRKVDGKEIQDYYDPKIENTLREMAALIKEAGPEAHIVIEGHTDSLLKPKGAADGAKGLEASVVQLSLRRATVVAEALVSRHGLDAQRISVVGLGWNRPADDKAPNDHAKNRRIEIVIYPPNSR